MSLPTVLVVTGTDTGVGKTIVTAALAATIAASSSVAVFKPAQTGVSPVEPGDIDEISRLTGISALVEGCRLRDPLAPTTAARREGVVLPSVAESALTVNALASEHDHVLVEGAGGLLVGLDSDGHGLCELAELVVPSLGFVVVARAGLGTLNHTRLTVEALQQRGMEVLGTVVGSDPAGPGLAEMCNVEDLPGVTGVPVVGRVPEGVSGLTREEFRRRASGWFSSWVELS